MRVHAVSLVRQLGGLLKVSALGELAKHHEGTNYEEYEPVLFLVYSDMEKY